MTIQCQITHFAASLLLKQHVFGEVYDVDTQMLKKLDELEEHPTFYERSEENVLVAPEAKAKASDTFDTVFFSNNISFRQFTAICYFFLKQNRQFKTQLKIMKRKRLKC